MSFAVLGGVKISSSERFARHKSMSGFSFVLKG